jgi:WhiB family redox-sensing transcriptional regulator
MTSAVCAQVDPELFSDPTQVPLAKKVCAGCPVINECLSWALSERLDYGVYGGMSTSARAAMRSRLPRIAPRRNREYGCGTDAGYKRHQREGSKACRACIDGHAEYRRLLAARAAA